MTVLRKLIPLSLVALSACATDVAEEPVHTAEQKLVYGNDDRVEVFESDSAIFRSIAEDSVLAMVRNRKFRIEDGEVKLVTSNLQQSQNLCEDERFSTQSTIASCTGTLIADDLVLTAGHCMASAGDCADSSWIFGIYLDGENSLNELTTEDVFECEEILDTTLVVNRDVSHDFAVFRLDRPATPRFSTVPVRTERTAIGEDTPVTVIGLGSGLPIKIDDGGVIAPERDQLDYFVSNSDAFGGNSGSGVFTDDGTLVGILVAGQNDFIFDEENQCKRVARLPDSQPAEQSSYAFRAIDGLCNTTARNDYVLCADRCGNGFCEVSESEGTCPEDCALGVARCGNAACEAEEAIWNCKVDCELTIPDEWTCDPLLYADGVSCNCGCGIIDSDCGEPDQELSGCEDVENSTGCDINGECIVNNIVCGDGTCEEGETDVNCVVDCMDDTPINPSNPSDGGSDDGCSTTTSPVTWPIAALLFIATLAYRRRLRF